MPRFIYYTQLDAHYDVLYCCKGWGWGDDRNANFHAWKKIENHRTVDRNKLMSGGTFETD